MTSPPPSLSRLETALILTGLTLACTPFALFGTDADALQASLPMRQGLWILAYALFGLLALPYLRRMIQAVRLALPVVLLTGLTTLSALWSPVPAQTLASSAALWACTFMGVYLAIRVSALTMARLLAIVLGVLAGASLLVVLLLPDYGLMTGVHDGLWNGVFTHKNVLGRSMVLGLICLVPLYSMASAGTKILLGLVAGMELVLLLNSQSATAFLLLLSCVLIYLLLRAQATLSGPARISLLAGALTLVAILAIYASDPGNAGALLEALGRDPTLTQRTRIWQAGLDALSERPWLGYGYDALWTSAAGSGFTLHYTTWAVPHVHNGFLEIVLALGVPGLLALALLMYRLLASATRPLQDSGLHVLLTLTLSTVIVLNMTEVNLLRYNNIFWILTLYTLLRLRLEAAGAQDGPAYGQSSPAQA